MAGTKDKVEGTIKEGVGKLTDDKQTEVEGKAQRFKGKVEDAAHEAKEGAKEGLERAKDKMKD